MAILEFNKIGNYMRVAAIDEVTGIEAISIMPSNISRANMEIQAVKKLEYVLNKKKLDKDSDGGYV